MSDQQAEVQFFEAEAYEKVFAPAVLRQWAPKVADAARIGPGHRVLDVACGTGVVTREVLSRVAPGGSVAGLDIAPGMLTVARRLAPSVEFRQGSAESLPWPDQSFDAVVCQFGLMFFPDRPKALREMLRVLVPGGRVAFAVWSSLEENPGFQTEAAIFERAGGPAAAAPLHVPFALGKTAELKHLLEEAGVEQVEVKVERATAQFPSIRTLIETDLGDLPSAGVVLDPEQVQRVLREADAEFSAQVGEDGTFRFPMSAHIAAGIRPPA